MTLELSPEDTEKLDLARSVGTLSLVLRNQLDKTKVATSGVTKAQLLGLKTVAETPVAVAKPIPVVARRVRAPVPQAAMDAPPAPCVEVIRAGTRALSCF